MFKQIITCTLLVLASVNALAQAQKGRSFERGYSKKLLEQNKYFDDLKKANGEKYGNKEVSVEIAVTKNIGVCVENINRAVEIKIWDQPKVKITAMVYFDGTISTLDNEAWMEKLNVKTRLLGNSLKIFADMVNANNKKSGSYSGSASTQTVEVYSVDGQYIKSEPANSKVLTIYVPKENNLCLKSKYSDVAITTPVKKLDADITNGSLELNDVANLSLTSKYANVYANEVDKAQVDFINGNLVFASLKDAEFETKYAKIEIGTVKKLTFSSTNDEYEIEQADVIDGNKSYGNMRVNVLNESITLDGTNADVKIKKISSTVTTIWFDDKYANLKLPLKEIKDFAVEYEGMYSTVYNNFSNNNATITANDKVQTEGSKISTTDASGSKFKATAGSGKAAQINVRCQNCTVDFK